MNFCLRPSKTIQFDILEKALKELKGEVGIDAAAESMKNRKMFKTEKYFGIDINLPLLKKGIATHNQITTFGILADLAKLDRLPEGSADVVVSTNTLYILKGQNKKAAIAHLCRLTAPSGTLICDSAIGELDELLTIIRQNFRDIKIIYFDNIFSHAYEKIFEKDGYLGSHPIAGSKPFLLLSWFISRLEYITRFFKGLNGYSLIICKEKNSKKNRNPFTVAALPLIDKNIYTLLD